jgi:hypothetical protein
MLTIEYVAVPEPASAWLFLAAAVSLVCRLCLGSFVVCGAKRGTCPG